MAKKSTWLEYVEGSDQSEDILSSSSIFTLYMYFPPFNPRLDWEP